MQDVIHVVESKSNKPQGDYFLRQILKVFTHPTWCSTVLIARHKLSFFVIFLQFEETIAELEKVQLDWAW
jgi:hypothetical protein